MSSRLAAEPTLRPVGEDDREFLLRVYASTREAELSAVAWAPGQRDAFLRMQFEAQDAYWREQRSDAEFSVVEVDGEPVGRLYVDYGEDEIRIVDLALLPEYRDQGLGSELLRPILAEGETLGVPVSVHVERGSPARRLYERLGFARVGATGAYDLLHRTGAP